MNILIAEDNLTIQMINREVMRKHGFRYDMASNGREAVEYAVKNNGKYDCCLMDVNMPEMDGIEATKLIRKMSSYFPILALTASASHKKACFDAGMDDFAQKPCLPNEILAKINKLSVKVYRLVARTSGFDVTEVMPADRQQAEELRDLSNRNLCKVILFENPNRALIVHKNTINKISYDYNVKGQLLTEENYTEMLANEDKELNTYRELLLKSFDE
jgi:CheY-like chemotaxis protein